MSADNTDASPKQELSRAQVRALIVALTAGALATVFFTLSGAASANDTRQFKDQLAAVGGIVLSLLVDSVVKSPRWTLRIASAALLLGATLPWLYQITPQSPFRELLRNANWAGAGMFSFGTAFLVKSANIVKADPL